MVSNRRVLGAQFRDRRAEPKPTTMLDLTRFRGTKSGIWTRVVRLGAWEAGDGRLPQLRVIRVPVCHKFRGKRWVEYMAVDHETLTYDVCESASDGVSRVSDSSGCMGGKFIQKLPTPSFL